MMCPDSSGAMGYSPADFRFGNGPVASAPSSTQGKISDKMIEEITEEVLQGIAESLGEY